MAKRSLITLIIYTFKLNPVHTYVQVVTRIRFISPQKSKATIGLRPHQLRFSR